MVLRRVFRMLLTVLATVRRVLCALCPRRVRRLFDRPGSHIGDLPFSVQFHNMLATAVAPAIEQRWPGQSATAKT